MKPKRKPSDDDDTKSITIKLIPSGKAEWQPTAFDVTLNSDATIGDLRMQVLARNGWVRGFKRPPVITFSPEKWSDEYGRISDILKDCNQLVSSIPNTVTFNHAFRRVQEVRFWLPTEESASIADKHLYSNGLHTNFCKCPEDNIPIHVLPNDIIPRVAVFWSQYHTGERSSVVQCPITGVRSEILQMTERDTVTPGHGTVVPIWCVAREDTYNIQLISRSMRPMRIPFRIAPHPGHNDQYCHQLIQTLEMNMPKELIRLIWDYCKELHLFPDQMWTNVEAPDTRESITAKVAAFLSWSSEQTRNANKRQRTAAALIQ